MKIIEINNLQKKYPNFMIDINEFSFTIGKSYLLLGENGSGKTTLIKLILSLIKPTAGKVVCNTNKIGYAPEHFSLPQFYTVKEFLYNLSLIKNVKFNNHFIYLFKLDENKKISALSKGMKQKINIIQALIHHPDLYIFDEPINGLDQESQNLFLEIINSLQYLNKTIIITTHFEKYFQNLNLQRLIMNNGKIYESID